jgi:hypothetical protein
MQAEFFNTGFADFVGCSEMGLTDTREKEWREVCRDHSIRDRASSPGENSHDAHGYSDYEEHPYSDGSIHMQELGELFRFCIDGSIDVEDLDEKYREAAAKALGQKHAEGERATRAHGA